MSMRARQPTPRKLAAGLAARAGRRPRSAILAAAVVACAWLSSAPGALAAAPAPAWSISSLAFPTALRAGSSASGGDQYVLTVTNVGGAPSSGTITLSDTLPVGVTLGGAPTAWDNGAPGEPDNSLSCSQAGQTVTCTITTTFQPSELFDVLLPLDVSAGASGTLVNAATVSGGGGAVASTSQGTPVSSSPPPFGFVADPAGVSTSITNADGTTDVQAGSHPYQLTVDLSLPVGSFDPNSGYYPADGEVRDLTGNLPAGVVVNPDATETKCTEAEFENPAGVSCPLSSQVGLVSVLTSLFGTVPYYSTEPLFNMVPPAGVPAEFGFYVHALGVFEHLTGSVRTGGDYGLSATGNDIYAGDPVLGIATTLWGNPSDPSHDPERGYCSYNPLGSSVCPSYPSVDPTTTPLVTMPSACSGPLTTTASADSWQNPGSFVTASGQSTDANGNPVGVTGCDQLPFTPTMTLQPTSSSADSASGVNFGLSLPDIESQTGLAEATLKKAVVTLPPGAALNPSAAAGRAGCTPAEIGIDNASEPTCPDSSKVGTVSITTPLLPDPLTGSVYLATQFDNPFDALVAGYLVAQADGALIKLAGQFQLNQQTGQITASFDNNPQLPFTDLQIQFFGGARGDLATPTQCGTYPVTSQLTPWSSVTPDNSEGTATASPSDSFSIDSNCSSGFAPSFAAWSANPEAGAYSPFELTFSRSDGDQFLSGLSVKLPPGMLAKLAGVQECSDAQLESISTQPGTGILEQQNPACPAASQVGTVQTSAGAGDPITIGGKAYLTGPYKGAPYGLAVVVPAIAGPFDLGSVVVRQALYVDPTTAQVTDVSDPFPTILDGIPLRIRAVDVDLNRPDFTVNPTSCDAMSVSSVFTSTLSATADASSRFQVGECAALAFAPKLRMSLTGKGRTRSGDHPNLVSTLTQAPGQANLADAKVTLPLSLALDPNNSQHVCNYDVAQAVHGGAVGCPSSTIIGSATAVTPLLSQPLTGKVYLVQGIRFNKQGQRIRTLPSLLIPLRGQIALDLRAQTSVNSAAGGKLVTTFATIPDAPVSKFVLTITGGPKGLLVITGRGRTVCGKAQVAGAAFGAQSGKTAGTSPRIATPACRAVHKQRHKHRRRR